MVKALRAASGVEERPLHGAHNRSPFIEEAIDLETLNSFSPRRRLLCPANRKLAGTEAERTAYSTAGPGIADLFLTDRSWADSGFRERVIYSLKIGPTQQGGCLD